MACPTSKLINRVTEYGYGKETATLDLMTRTT
jgi:hypothetical protein